MKKRIRNQYVWRLDFSLLEQNHDDSEIGREIKKHIGLYKAVLLIGVFCGCFLNLMPIAMFIYHADLAYIIIFGMLVLLTDLLCGKIIRSPKISRDVLENIENEINVKSERMKEFDAIFTENALIVLQGIMVYRIPYHEISRIRIERYSRRAGGTRVYYKLCDGSQVETIYYGSTLQFYATYNETSYDLLWEKLLEYNPDIRIEDPLWHG